LLVIEIAAGVLLGLLAYRGIDSYCSKRNLTLTAAILWNLRRLLVWTAVFGVVAGIGFVLYYIITHPRWLLNYEYELFIGMVILVTLAFLFALRSEIREGRKYKAVAKRTACDKCGEMSLKFTSFKSGVGEYAHPRAKCSGCGNDQMLVPLA
jgi:hypothetical protein